MQNEICMHAPLSVSLMAAEHYLFEAKMNSGFLFLGVTTEDTITTKMVTPTSTPQAQGIQTDLY